MYKWYVGKPFLVGATLIATAAAAVVAKFVAFLSLLVPFVIVGGGAWSDRQYVAELAVVC